MPYRLHFRPTKPVHRHTQAAWAATHWLDGKQLTYVITMSNLNNGYNAVLAIPLEPIIPIGRVKNRTKLELMCEIDLQNRIRASVSHTLAAKPTAKPKKPKP